MSTILFDKIVFGPIHSRRLGTSLGINLLPADGKYAYAFTDPCGGEGGAGVEIDGDEKGRYGSGRDYVRR